MQTTYQYTKKMSHQQQQQGQRQQQQQQQLLQELKVIKSELTSGDTSGLVYVRSGGSCSNTSSSSSSTTAFLVTPRHEILQEVNEKLAEMNS